tara:strand:+ start:23 stop:229 length:207 start_codon:yes stop_codon:yes gene_type:complete
VDMNLIKNMENKMTRLLEQVLHNEESGVILITVSDQLPSDTLKKIYNLILDEEIKLTKDDTPKVTKNG